MTPKSNPEKAKRTWETKEFPGTVLIDNCSACNLSCSMCDHKNLRKYRRPMVMDRGLYERIIDEIAEKNPKARIWEIFFGDPFLCRDMAGRIAYAKGRGLADVVLNTNGQLMNEKKARAVIEAGLDAMYVGVDAATAATYEKIRVGGSFEKAVKNVLGYRDLLREIGKPGQKLFVQFVVSSLNEHEEEAFREFWKAEGVNVKIRPKVSWAGLVSAANLSDNREVERRPCYWVMQTMNICADGRVALCSVDVHCRVPSGDVTKSSLEEIWKNELKKLRDLHAGGRFDELPDMCRECRDWQSAYADFC